MERGVTDIKRVCSKILLSMELIKVMITIEIETMKTRVFWEPRKIKIGI